MNDTSEEELLRIVSRPLDEAKLRSELLAYRDLEVHPVLAKLLENHRSYDFLAPLLRLYLGPCPPHGRLTRKQTSQVAEIVGNLLWRLKRDPTYGGNIRNVIEYYRSCEPGSRALILHGLLQMLESENTWNDARVLISGLPLFAKWRNEQIGDGTRLLGEKVPGERMNPAFPKGRIR